MRSGFINRPGIEYEAEELDRFFAEDLQAISDFIALFNWFQMVSGDAEFDVDVLMKLTKSINFYNLNNYIYGGETLLYLNGAQFIQLNVGGVQKVILGSTAFSPNANNVISLGDGAHKFKNLYIAGIAYLASLNINGEYNLPTVDGGAGQTLVTDGAGVLSWATAGGGGVQKFVVNTKSDNYAVLTSDLGKTLVMDTAVKTFTLPTVGADDVGMWFKFVKLNIGRLTIQAADFDTISDSGEGKTIYNDQASEAFATITLELIAVGKWVITGADGTWITTQ